jgi:peptidoglycan/xylan/chitin deacetylase (PgdA/CDA1 family)
LGSKQIEEMVKKSGLKGSFSPTELINKSTVFRAVKGLPDQDRLQFLDSIVAISSREFGIDVTRIKNEMLTWSQIREVSINGIEIGSHTVSHPILTKLSHERLRVELEQSKAIIEEKTGEKVVSLAYPVGGFETFADSVIKAVNSAGYDFSVCYLDGVDKTFHRGMHELKRIRVEENQSLSLFRTRLALLPLKRAFKR